MTPDATKEGSSSGRSVNERLIDPANPCDLLRRRFENGRKLHYERFLPDAATDLLAGVQFDPALALLEPVDAVEMLVSSMPVYRQSARVGEFQFISCGRACLRLVSTPLPSARRDELSALICAAAWELVAVTVQRGWAREGIPLLEKVERLLSERDLWPCLHPGRDRSMLRLEHWARVVGHQDLAQAKSSINRNGHLLDIEAARKFGPAEVRSVVQQKMAELLRLARQEHNAIAIGQAEGLFEDHMRPVLAEITAATGAFEPGPHPHPVARSITPSTALATAFGAFFYASQVRTSNTNEIIDNAVTVANHLHRTSENAVMLQMMNWQSECIFNDALRGSHRKAELSRVFRCVPKFSEHGKEDLHDLAEKLLAKLRD